MAPAIHEGSAIVTGQDNTTVFYNPVQEFNRDMSIAILSKFGEVFADPLIIYEGLSATGLRSVRYAKEVEKVKAIYANDFDKAAFECISNNVKSNDVSETVIPFLGDANVNMSKLNTEGVKPNVIDVDPFGSPAPFIDRAVQSVAEGGLLLVTATDLAVLCGQVPEKSYALYGSFSIKAPFMHENALRILLYSISRHASIYGRYIVPQLSFFVDFYIRVAVRVFTKPSIVKNVCTQHSIVNYCTQCSNFLLTAMAVKSGLNKFVHSVVNSSTKCAQCESSMRMGGPIWNGPLHDPKFLSQVHEFVKSNSGKFGTFKKMLGVLTVLTEEVLDTPLFVTKEMIFSSVKISAPKLTLISSALLNAGYKFSVSHCSAAAIKTDAPMSVIWDIVRQYEKDHPVNREKVPEFSRTILSRDITSNINFHLHPDANPLSRTQKIARFPMNPPNWGPGSKPCPVKAVGTTEESSQKSQNGFTCGNESSNKMSQNGAGDFEKESPPAKSLKLDKESSDKIDLQ